MTSLASPLLDTTLGELYLNSPLNDYYQEYLMSTGTDSLENS